MRLKFTGVKFFKVMNIKLINLPSERSKHTHPRTLKLVGRPKNYVLALNKKRELKEEKKTTISRMKNICLSDTAMPPNRRPGSDGSLCYDSCGTKTKMNSSNVFKVQMFVKLKLVCHLPYLDAIARL